MKNTVLKNRKLAMLLSMLLISFEGYSQEQKTKADNYWNTKPPFMYQTKMANNEITNIFLPGVYKDDSNMGNYTFDEFKRKYSREVELNKKDFNSNVYIFKELQRRYFREWGMHFWRNFPNDERRFEWLKEASIEAPRYLAKTEEIADFSTSENGNVATVDTAGLARWLHFFQNSKEEYIFSKQVSNFDKSYLLAFELIGALDYWVRSSTTYDFDTRDWLNKLAFFKDWAVKNLKEPMHWSTLSYSFKQRILERHYFFGLDDSETMDFVDRVEQLGIPEFQSYIDQYRKPDILAKLQQHPLKFGIKSTAGKSVEPESYKGKLLLVDFWSLGCASCISGMPGLKRIFDKYKSYGFEVVSACKIVGRNSKGEEWYPNEKERIKFVHETKAGDWPLVLIDGKIGETIWKNYNFKGVPQMFLFDENGKLLYHNGPLYDSMEIVVRNHLASKGKIKE